MPDTSVCIVGAGPAGLVLGLSLANFGIRSIILEKEPDITEDPRGVYLTHDACRICWDLGIGKDMFDLGHVVHDVQFHRTSFQAHPFYKLSTGKDVVKQTIPNGVLHIQPRLEKALRDAVAKSKYCELRCSCKVVDRAEEEKAISVQYLEKDEAVTKTIKASWLVGADGKKGIVRKYFLEPTAGIKQVNSDYQYEGTWVAANFKLHLPTKESHPNFPLWELGYTPEQVYDLFWPEGWHFVTPPAKAVATGRFGPHEARYWRHEFEQSDWTDDMDAEALMWDNLTPMITVSRDSQSEKFPFGAVTFPRDCIEIIRCRPFKFTHKVVNKWSHKRTILIGDAAHVFPPFGGQGIASGMRDAHQLAWRLALIEKASITDERTIDHLLRVWSAERSQSVKDASMSTKMNGDLCNGLENFVTRAMLRLDILLRQISCTPQFPHPLVAGECRGFSHVKTGAFHSEYAGGSRVAQCYVAGPKSDLQRLLSDSLLRGHSGVMTLLVIGDVGCVRQRHTEALETLEAASVSHAIMGPDSIVSILRESASKSAKKSVPNKWNDTQAFWLCPGDALDEAERLVDGYDEQAFWSRFTPKARYVIVRPDFYIYAQARSTSELKVCLSKLQEDLLCRTS